MLQKALLGGIGLLLLVAGVLAWRAFDAEPQLAPPAARGAVAVEAAASSTGLVQPTATEASETPGAAERAVVSTPGEATQRPLPADPHWVAVRIVDRASSSPVPGAIVHWFDETAPEYLQERNRGAAFEIEELRWHGERLAELAGWRTRSDADGIARVTLKESTTVLARHESAYGRLQLESTSVTPVGGHVLELQPDLALTVRAIDERSAPCAGVPVTVTVCDREGRPTGWSGMEPLARTRADGLATIPHLQDLERNTFGPFGNAEAGQQWRAMLVLPGHDDPGVVVDFAALPAEPVELRVPACGSMRVRAVFAGKPVPGFDNAWLSSANNNEGEWRPRPTRRAPADPDGQVRFPWVPVGVKYRVGSNAMGGLNTEAPGPRHPGHEVEVVLAPPNNAMLLAGRLLLPDQSPLAEQKVQMRLTGPLRAHTELRTDRDGRFLVTVGSPRKDNRVDQLWFEVARKGEAPLRAEAPPRTLRSGTDELGDLVLGGGVLIVAGRIVTGEQPFLEPVNLRVERFETAAAPIDRSEAIGNFQSPEQREQFERFLNARTEQQRGPRWRVATGMLEHKDGLGGFTIRGPAVPGRHRLVVNSQKVLPVEPIEFVVGATDVVVQVDQGQSLAASVLLPERAPAEYVSAVLVPAVAPPKPSGRLTQTLGEVRAGKHHVQWLSVLPGTYTLELRMLTLPSPLVAIPDVVLPPPAGGDPRLAGIDLRSLVRVVTLDARDADGQPIADVNGAAFPTPPTLAEWLGHACHMPNQRFLLPAGPYELVVCLNGYRPQPARGDGDVVTVRLDPWPTLSVLVADVPELPANARVQVSLQPAERSELKYRTQWSSGDRSELLAPPRRNVALTGGKAAVPIGDGLFTIRLTVSGNRRSHTIEGHEPKQVLSTAGEVTVVVPKAQWDKAIEVVKQAPAAPRQVPGEVRR